MVAMSQDPVTWLTFGGTLVIDDFTPLREWPARYHGEIDTGRLYWLTHPALLATEVAFDEDSSTVVARYVPR
jgi:hypothetical protein